MAGTARHRVGLLGFGLAGEAFHAPLIEATDGLELAVIVTSDAERAARASAAYPQATVTGDPTATSTCELLVVATPNRFHVPYASEALRRGIHVVVDKPLATTLADVDGLVALSQSSGDRLTVFQNRRWDGDFLTARQLIADGSLGTVTRLQSRFERFRPAVKDGWREAGDPRDGGGQLLDLGVHLIDQALQLLGPATSVYAELDRRRPGVQTEDDVFLALTHACGARAHLSMGAVSPVPADRITLSGTAAGFSVRDLDVQEAQLRAGLTPAADAYGLNPPGTLHDERGSRPQLLARGDYPAFYAGVRDWLSGAAPPVDPADSRAVFAVIEAARRSADRGQTVPLN